MSKTITVLKINTALSEVEIARIKARWDYAMRNNDNVIVLDRGVEITQIQVGDGEVLHCAYCHNPLERCGCGAKRPIPYGKGI